MASTTKATPAKAPAKRTARVSGKQATQAALKAKAPKRVSAKPAAKAKATNVEGLREKVRDEYEAGATRAQLRAKHGLTYPQVYNMTKDQGTREHGRDRIVIDDPDNKGKQISRRAAMRRDYAAGMSVGDIGRKYGVIYQVARQAVLDLLPEGGQRAAKAPAKGKAAAKQPAKRTAKAPAKAKATG